MTVTAHRLLTGTDVPPAWVFYVHVFDKINTEAANRHLMYEHEFHDMCNNPEITKYLDINADGTLVGMSVITNNLHQWHLISPEYFAHHWPEHYARRAIWYIGFVGVNRAVPHTGRVFHDLIAAMYPQVRDSDGLYVMDCCTANEARGVPKLTGHTVTSLHPGANLVRADAQSFWVGTLNPTAEQS